MVDAGSGADTPAASTMRPRLSIIVPFFNEMHRLDGSLARIVALAADDVEVILVDDGSTDGTGAALCAAAAAHRVHLVSLPRNQGKGAAVRAGVTHSSGDRVVFMDADLATDLADLPLLTDALEHAEVAIGSRAVSTAEISHATWARSWMGVAFNHAVRITTRLPLRDTQCGFKAFRGDVARSLFARSKVDGFAFDVEVLLLARSQGLRIAEVPVRWTEVHGSKVRVALDPLRMLLDLAVLGRRARTGGRAPEPVPINRPVISESARPV